MLRANMACETELSRLLSPGFDSGKELIAALTKTCLDCVLR